MTLSHAPCPNASVTTTRMPLRQFRARGRSPPFSHYGQWRWPDRPIAAPPWCRSAPRHSSVASTRAGMPANPSRPATNWATAISFAALSTVGAAPPAASAWRAMRERREAHGIGLLEGQRRDASKIQPLRRGANALGIGQAMGDRDAHIRRAELRDHRAVAKFHQPMDDRLRMYDDIEFVRRQSEQVPRFDQFKPLVHQRR